MSFSQQRFLLLLHFSAFVPFGGGVRMIQQHTSFVKTKVSSQDLQSHLAGEMSYCRSRSRDMAIELHALEAAKVGQNRAKRSWLFGQFTSDVSLRVAAS